MKKYILILMALAGFYMATAEAVNAVVINHANAQIQNLLLSNRLQNQN